MKNPTRIPTTPTQPRTPGAGLRIPGVPAPAPQVGPGRGPGGGTRIPTTPGRGSVTPAIRRALK